jgi:hypothetical protein
MAYNIPAANFKNITATTTIATGPCWIFGIWVSAASSTPTIVVTDAAATGTSAAFAPSFTPVAATYYQMPACLSNGLTVTIGGTVNCTVMWGPSG